MAAKRDGTSCFICDDNFGSKAAHAFWDRHKAPLTELAYLADHYAAAADGDSLLLLDACLLGIAQRGRDHLQRMSVEVQTLPPSIGDELSKKML